jgi:hypothetical protein
MLVILCDLHSSRDSVHDGWGHSDVEKGNAVMAGSTKNMDTLGKDGHMRYIAAHGLSVGLNDGLMGNSEVGYVVRYRYHHRQRVEYRMTGPCHLYNPGLHEVISTLGPGASFGRTSLELMNRFEKRDSHNKRALLHPCSAQNPGMAVYISWVW